MKKRQGQGMRLGLTIPQRGVAFGVATVDELLRGVRRPAGGVAPPGRRAGHLAHHELGPAFAVRATNGRGAPGVARPSRNVTSGRGRSLGPDERRVTGAIGRRELVFRGA